MKDAPGTRDYDWWMLAILAAICALGVIEIYSATHASNLVGMHIKQIKWLIFGFAVMFLLSRVDYHLILDQALIHLARADPRAARVVKLRFFGGMDEDEVAEILGVSTITVKRDWKVARAWLMARLR